MGTYLVDAAGVNAVALLLLGFLTFFSTPVVFTIPMELPRVHPSLVAMITSVILAAAGVFSFAAPSVVGWLTDLTGSYLPGFLVFALAACAPVLAAWQLPETGRAARRYTAVTGF